MRFITLILCCLGCMAFLSRAATQWRIVDSPVTAPIRFVVWGNGHWLAGAANDDDNGKTTLLRSEDGVSWKADSAALKVGKEDTFFPVGRMFFTGGRFLISSGHLVDSTARWASSVDGVTWEPFPVPEGVRIFDVVSAAGRWVCVGARGTFATAVTPGEWTVDASRITSTGLTRVVWLGDRFHAFGSDNYGLLHYASTTAEATDWVAQPRAPVLIALDSLGSLEMGGILTNQGTVENVMVVTGNSQSFLVGRASPEGIAWTPVQRQGFGRLIHRKSADPAAAGGFRHEWVNPSWSIQPVTEVEILRLRQSNEVTARESLATSLGVLAMTAGPDAMIAVGQGGLIRRYPTGLAAATAPVDLEIGLAVQLKWSSRRGHEYLIEHSEDGQKWTAWMPALAGTGGAMTWTQPADQPRRFFRVREQ